MEFPQARILIFAKPPIAGYCKTRLGKRLGMQRAAAVHAELSEHAVQTAADSQLATVELYCDGDPAHPFFLHLRRKHQLPLRRQSGPDLGARMLRAFRGDLKVSAHTLIIGTDCPVLSQSQLSQALAELAAGQDAVFIPSEDGGYAAIGLRKPEPLLFRHIDWGTHRVMQQTRQRLQRLGMNWTELEPLWDVDEREDHLRARRLGLLSA